MEDYDDNNDNADGVETESDHLKITPVLHDDNGGYYISPYISEEDNELTKLSDDNGHHVSPYISEEDELTEENDEFEESEIIEDACDGIINIIFINVILIITNTLILYYFQT